MATLRGAREAPITGALMAFARVDARREQALERVSARLGAMYGAATAAVVERLCIVGSRENCAARIGELRAAGVEHLILAPIAAPVQLDDQLGSLAEASVRSRQAPPSR